MTKNTDRIGLVHLYTGNGKGKTTAAAGLALRALGYSWRVLFCQFLKATPSGETAGLEQLGAELLRASCIPKFSWTLTEEERKLQTDSHTACLSEVVSRQADYDLIVLDEVVDAVNCGFLPLGNLVTMIESRPPWQELVLTGRSPAEPLVKLADYHTDFVCLKHPYERGIAAREGIER